MILIIKVVVFTVIWCLGLKIVLSEGMVFEKIGKFITDKVEVEHKKIYEPLGYCEFCMPSIHTLFGIAFALASNTINLSWNIAILYPIFVMASSFLTGVIWNIYGFLKTKQALAESQIKLTDKKEELTHFKIKDRKEKHYQANKK